MAEEEDERGGGLCWCLKRVGPSQERLLLADGEEVTVGRGVGVTHQLVSAVCPLMISRTHCAFRQNAEGHWTVTDNNSLNGVWVNMERLEPQKSHLLTKGCSIQLGVPLQNQERPEFEYQLVQENLQQIRPFLTRPVTGKSKPARNKRKLTCDDSEASGTESTSNSSKSKVQRVAKHPTRSQKSDLTKQPTVKVLADQPDCYIDSDMMAATQQQCPNALWMSQIRQSIAELRGLHAQAQEKQLAVQEKMKSPQDSKCLQSAQQELHKLQQQLSSRREEHLQRVNELQICQQEQDSKSCPGVSKPAEEEDLKEQLAEALQEHSLLMDELDRSHRNFELMIQAKNRELQETKMKEERMEAQREEVFSQMNDVLDNELQCIICSEHFIEAVTLNCAHSFCAFCIQSWRKRKDECPICRQPIHSQTRSLVLDNCIDRMVDKLSPDMKERRLALIQERKANQQQQQAIPISILDSDSSSALSDISLISSIDSDDPEDHGMDSTTDDDDSELTLDSEEDDFDDFGFLIM